ncbi:recombinase family protein [Lachnospiraceae bacterium 62-35]
MKPPVANSQPLEKRAALYIRVSTHSQEELSPDSQRRLLLDYASSHHLKVSSSHIYQENGISGRTAMKRPRFQEMIAAAKSKDHPFDVILVWKYSRFARNQEESIVYKSMLRNKCQVEVISISEPLIDGPFGSLIERIIEWMDEFYSIRLSGDVKRGMVEKAMRGGCQCRPPLGYSIPYHNAPLAIVPDEAKLILMIFEKYVYGHMSLLALTRHLNDLGLKTARGNPFEKRSLEYILSNPIYAGDIRWNRKESASSRLRPPEEWIMEKGTHPAIIPQTLFDLAQLRLSEEGDSSRRSRPSEAAKHWLSGLLKCPYCGSTLSSCIRRRKTLPPSFTFQCCGYLKGKCPHSSYVSGEAVTSAVLKAIQDAEKYYDSHPLSIRVSQTGRLPSSGNTYERSLLTKQLELISLKIQRAQEAYLDGIDTKEEYSQSKERLEKKAQYLKKQLLLEESTFSSKAGEGKRELESVPVPTGLSDILISPAFTDSQKNTALKSIVEKIIYDKKQKHIDILYRFFPPG